MSRPKMPDSKTPYDRNWPAAFVAFCQGHPLEEISEVFGIPGDHLRNRANTEKWEALRAQLPQTTQAHLLTPELASGQRNPFGQGAALPLPAPAQNMSVQLRGKFEVLLKNRTHNLEQANRLRAHADKLLTKLEAGELKIEQIFNGKEGTRSDTRDLNLQDLVAFATYVKMIHEMTYRALGDISATEKGSQDAPVAQGHGIRPITIILPGIIAEPRHIRAAKAAGAEIVDVPSEVAPAAPAASQEPTTTLSEASQDPLSSKPNH